MIVGIGVDIVKVSKMEEAVLKGGESFLKRVFNDCEISHLAKGAIYFQRLAARFAAKEAVIKSLGKTASLSWRDIVVINLESGMPVCRLSLPKYRDLEILISLSHIEDYAVATAVAQKKA